MVDQNKDIIFVTGATGVLGRRVIRLLREQRLVARALCRSEANARAVSRLGGIPVYGDLFDFASIRKAIKGSCAVLHLATRIPPSSRMKSQSAWIENDRIRREGTRNVIEAAVVEGVQTAIYQSVCLAYQSSGATWIDAASCATLPAPSLLSTLDAEKTVFEFGVGGRRAIILRMGQFYGPQAEHTNTALRLAHRGIAVEFGDSDSYHSTIWINDAASAVVQALQQARSGTYDVVDDEPLTNHEFSAALAAAVGRSRLWRLPHWLVRASVGKGLQTVLGRSQRVQNTRLKTATGWSPEISDARIGLALCQKLLASGTEERDVR